MPTRDQLQPAHPARDWRTRDVLAELGGAPAIAEALELATYAEPPDALPSKERQLLEMLGDPAYANYTLPTLMKRVGLLLPDLLDVLRKRDIALAVARSGQAMDGVLRGVETMAQERWAICPKCMGECSIIDTSVRTLPGEPPALMDCPACADDGVGRSTGKVLKEPNLEAVQIYLGVHGIGKRGGGGAQVINVNANAQAGARAESGGKERSVPTQESVTDRVQAMLEGGGSSGQ